MKLKLIVLSLLLFCSFTVMAQDEAPVADSLAVVDSLPLPAPPTNVVGTDNDNDHGHAILISWELSADDGQGQNSVLSYEIFRWFSFTRDDQDMIRDTLDVLQKLIDLSASSIKSGTDAYSIKTIYEQYPKDELFDYRTKLTAQLSDLVDEMPDNYKSYPESGEWRLIGKAPSGSTSFLYNGNKDFVKKDYIQDYLGYYFRVDAVTVDESVRSSSEVVGPIESYGQWFHNGRIPVLIAILVFCALTVIFVTKARSGSNLYVRPLGGIEAVDDAIGRATEMGRPILYVLGLGTAADVATIASFTILGRVAKKVAEYKTDLIVPTYDPIVMSVAQEVVKSAYFDAGCPDDYKEDTVYFVTQSQFAYVAAVNGTMLRELPATNVYMGKFFAESLLLAETGALAGSIQISGTDEIAQIPFFIVACDFTLIGEELYAASAYLGREPKLLGSLKAQDYAKAAVVICALIGMIASNFGSDFFSELFKVID